MWERGLRSVHVKRVKALADSRKAQGDGHPNLLQGRTIFRPLEALAGDITYIPADEGFDHLCRVKDIATGIILAACQCTAKEVMGLPVMLGIRQSFSRMGMPGDNAWSESFFSILKKEAVHPLRFHSRCQASQPASQPASKFPLTPSFIIRKTASSRRIYL